MSARKPRYPKDSLDALEFVKWLDSQREYSLDTDGTTRVYVNGVWLDPDFKRELRRYRNGHIVTIRTDTAKRLLSILNLSLGDFHGRS
jgi:hypothetical protein